MFWKKCFVPPYQRQLWLEKFSFYIVPYVHSYISPVLINYSNALSTWTRGWTAWILLAKSINQYLRNAWRGFFIISCTNINLDSWMITIGVWTNMNGNCDLTYNHEISILFNPHFWVILLMCSSCGTGSTSLTITIKEKDKRLGAAKPTSPRPSTYRSSGCCFFPLRHSKALSFSSSLA